MEWCVISTAVPHTQAHNSTSLTTTDTCGWHAHTHCADSFTMSHRQAALVEHSRLGGSIFVKLSLQLCNGWLSLLFAPPYIFLLQSPHSFPPITICSSWFVPLALSRLCLCVMWCDMSQFGASGEVTAFGGRLQGSILPAWLILDCVSSPLIFTLLLIHPKWFGDSEAQQ